MSSSPGLVIFDCDGVLVDSEVIGVRMDRQVLAEHGWQLGEQEVLDRFLGTPLPTVQAALEEHLGRKLADDWTERLQQRYLDAFEQGLEPVPGIREVLERLDGPYCVASSSSPERIRHSLALTGLDGFFDDAHLFSAEQVEHGKPAPDLFLFAAERMGAAPSDCVVVEDSHHGVAAARAAGMRSLGFAGGVTPASWLQGGGTTVFTSMAELPGLLGL